jgi:hypothetical protein
VVCSGLVNIGSSEPKKVICFVQCTRAVIVVEWWRGGVKMKNIVKYSRHVSMNIK